MTNTSCELGHSILTSTWVPILLSEYQILNEYSPSTSICFSPNYNIVHVAGKYLYTTDLLSRAPQRTPPDAQSLSQQEDIE